MGRAGNGSNRSNSSNRPKIQHIQGLPVVAAPVVHTPSSRPSSVAGGWLLYRFAICCKAVDQRCGCKVAQHRTVVGHKRWLVRAKPIGAACDTLLFGIGGLLGRDGPGAEAQLHGESRVVGCEVMVCEWKGCGMATWTCKFGGLKSTPESSRVAIAGRHGTWEARSDAQ